MLKNAMPLTSSWELLIDFDEHHTCPEEALTSKSWVHTQVPGCWDVQTNDKLSDGAVWYKHKFNAPAAWRDKRTALDFQGVNYYCEIWLNGERIGEHEGGWNGFRVEAGDALLPGESNELVLRVYKQGKKFPLRQCLAGFLPDVGVIFGGIWKPVHVGLMPAREFSDVFIQSEPDACSVKVSYRLTAEAGGSAWTLAAVLYSPDGSIVSKIKQPALALDNEEGLIEIAAVEKVTPWSPENPQLYRLELTLEHDGTEVDWFGQRFGMRQWRTEQGILLLNGSPVHLRGILYWGWEGDLIAPTPDREAIRAELTRLKEGGFNMVKHCLYVPVRDYFELAGELGIVVWQELPMWLPDVNVSFKQRVFTQYEAIIKELRCHTSIAIWTLGCELNHEADADFLKALYEQAKVLTGGAIIRDNSGSGECYGGLLKENADFYDYHFYTDIHFYPELLGSFAAPWREKKPWLFGEFCDYDEFRAIGELIERRGRRPWWLQSDTALNPVARDERWHYHRQDEKLAALRLPFTETQLVANARESAFVYRKAVLELVRAYPPVNGYSLTSIRDSGLATSAVFDDFGQWKQPPERFRQINGETILIVTWDARRDWVHGGDRLTKWDPYNYAPGETVRPHLAVSHYGVEPVLQGVLHWSWSIGRQIVASGSSSVDTTRPGDFKPIAVAEWTLLATEEPVQIMLRAAFLENGHVLAENEWPIWVLPELMLGEAERSAIAVSGCSPMFEGWAALHPGIRRWSETGTNEGVTILLTDQWTSSMEAFTAKGGRALYVERGYGPLAVKRAPFWRESLQLFHEHPVLARFPHRDHTSMLLFGLATDLVLDRERLGEHVPIMDRLDARVFELDRYMIEERFGKGVRLSTTLRLEGGLGSQPEDLAHNPAARYLLNCILKHWLSAKEAAV